MPVEPSKVGIRKCLKCQFKFVSPDVKRLSRCQDCSHGEDAYTPRTADLGQVAAAVRSHYGRDAS